MISRRAVLAASGAALLAPRAMAQDAPAVSDAARTLYANAIVIDCNIYPPFGETMTKAEVNAVKASGLTAAKASMGGFANSYDQTLIEVRGVKSVIDRYQTDFMQVRSVADIRHAKQTGRLGIIFSFEGVECLQSSVARIEEFAALGVKVMQLSYNRESPFGAGVLADPALGLTGLGREAVAAMNANGVALDLSHANPATTAQAMEASTKPVLMTHGGCTAVHNHPRNKTDEQLRALAAKGGVFGVYDLPYLVAPPREATLDDYMAHMTHALNVAGEDHVGIGSDTAYDHFPDTPEARADMERQNEERRRAGVAAPGEDARPLFVQGLNHVRRCETIADALLARGHSVRVAEKVLGENFLRAFGDIW
jgi:membrane dipeptidase